MIRLDWGARNSKNATALLSITRSPFRIRPNVIKERFRISISHFPSKINEYAKAELSRLGVIITKMLYKVSY